MAKLINCKLCKSEMSSNATKCPKCGEKNNQRTSPIAWALLLVILYFLYTFIRAIDAPQQRVSTITKTSYTSQDFVNSAYSTKEQQAIIWNGMSEEEQNKASQYIWSNKELIPYFFDKTYDPKNKTLYINKN